jgi:hypothetical protein
VSPLNLLEQPVLIQVRLEGFSLSRSSSDSTPQAGVDIDFNLLYNLRGLDLHRSAQ